MYRQARFYGSRVKYRLSPGRPVNNCRRASLKSMLYLAKTERKKMNKYTIAQIMEAWDAAFGEDMQAEYPGFFQRLQEEKDASTKKD